MGPEVTACCFVELNWDQPAFAQIAYTVMLAL